MFNVVQEWEYIIDGLRIKIYKDQIYIKKVKLAF